MIVYLILGWVVITILLLIFLLFNHGGHLNQDQENDDKEQIEYLRKYEEDKRKRLVKLEEKKYKRLVRMGIIKE